jgi:CRISPR-associated protein Cmr3
MTNSSYPLYWYALEPLDILMLREAKPFSPGDGAWAKGQFPPLPITVFQALRSATEWVDENAPSEAPRQRTNRNMHFLGPLLLQDQHQNPDHPILWLPTPKDLLSAFSIAIDEDAEDGSKTPPSHWDQVAQLQPLDPADDRTTHFRFPPTPSGASLNPMLPPWRSSDESWGYGRIDPWMKATALAHYLQGRLDQIRRTDFCEDPWKAQVLPHIKVQSGTRQVESEDGYFTEVAIRLKPGWKLVAAFSEAIDPGVVRLGGEGHRVLVSPLPSLQDWDALQPFMHPPTDDRECTAYLLTPGLAEAADQPFVYSVYPGVWQDCLQGCASDRPLLWGGMTVFQKPGVRDKEAAFAPQRAFVPPGTIYRFDRSPTKSVTQLLPKMGGSWLETFEKLGYGTLLWSQSN